LNWLQNSIKIPYSNFKVLFKSLKYIQNSLKSVLKYSWFGKGRKPMGRVYPENHFKNGKALRR